MMHQIVDWTNISHLNEGHWAEEKEKEKIGRGEHLSKTMAAYLKAVNASIGRPEVAAGLTFQYLATSSSSFSTSSSSSGQQATLETLFVMLLGFWVFF